MHEISMKNRAQGSIAGLSIGDALGRPVEGFTPREIQEKWGRVEGYVSDDPLGSDDTEYALLTALALITYPKSFNANNIAKLWVDKVCNQKGGSVAEGSVKCLPSETSLEALSHQEAGSTLMPGAMALPCEWLRLA